MPLVSVISVNYNQPAATEKMIASVLHKNQYEPVELIVVDNGSADNPVPGWQERFPGVIFIRSEKNLGFAGGNNLGLQAARGAYFFLINNDTEVDALTIGKLVHTMEAHPGVGVLSPQIRYYDHPEKVQYLGYTRMNYFTGRNRAEADMDAVRPPGPTGYAHGAAMMLRRGAVDTAGLMDESYFLYYEELDWCERIRKAGFDIWVEPRALIYHKESLSVGVQSPLKEYYMIRNRMLFQRRHAPGWKLPFFILYYLAVATPVQIFRHLRHGRFHLVPPVLKGIGWHLGFRNKKNLSLS